MHSILRKKAILLREKGFSYGLISQKLKVSKSTLSNWLSGMLYVPNDIVKNRVTQRLLAFVMAKHEKKLASLKRIKYEMRNDLLPLSKRDLHLFGLGIYLGEGTKMSLVRIVNSDPRVIKFSILWLQKIFNVPQKNFVIRIHLYPDSDEKKTIRYWSQITGLPRVQFYKSQFDKRTNKSIRNKKKLRYGTAHLSVKSCGQSEYGVILHRKIMSSIDVIFENFGIIN